MAVASSAPAHHAAGVSRGHLGTRPGARAPRLRRLQSTRPPRVLVSAAGPGGAWLSRSWTTTGPGGWGVAPALLPTQPGERGKPHWRDAIQLARRRHSGALPPVHGPAVAAAARRDRGRARAAASGALQTAQWRRPASRSTGRAPWGPAPLRGRSAVGWPPRRRRAWATPPSARSRTTPHGGCVWHQHARPRGRPRRPPPSRPPPTAAALSGLHPLGRRAGRAAPPGRPHQAGAHPGPQTSPDLRGQAQGRLGQRSWPRSARGHNAPPVGVAIARACSAFMWARAQAGPLPPSRKTGRRVAAGLRRWALALGRDTAPVWGRPR